MSLFLYAQRKVDICINIWLAVEFRIRVGPYYPSFVYIRSSFKLEWQCQWECKNICGMITTNPFLKAQNFQPFTDIDDVFMWMQYFRAGCQIYFLKRHVKRFAPNNQPTMGNIANLSRKFQESWIKF